jgi:hypothetical protein
VCQCGCEPGRAVETVPGGRNPPKPGYFVRVPAYGSGARGLLLSAFTPGIFFSVGFFQVLKYPLLSLAGLTPQLAKLKSESTSVPQNPAGE